MRRTTLLPLLAPVLSGCVFSPAAPEDRKEGEGASGRVPRGGSVPPLAAGETHRVLLEGPRTQHATPGRVLVANEGEWESLGLRHQSGVEPLPPLPVVDFASHVVLAVFLGDRPDTCWRMGVDSVAVDATADVREVSITVHAPGPGSGCFNAVVRPYALVLLPNDGKPLVFHEQVRQGASSPT